MVNFSLTTHKEIKASVVVGMLDWQGEGQGLNFCSASKFTHFECITLSEANPHQSFTVRITLKKRDLCIQPHAPLIWRRKEKF